MCTRVVVDAASIGVFQTARICGTEDGKAAMQYVLDNCRIVADAGGRMLSEWMTAANCGTHSGLALEDWIADQRAEGRLITEPYKADGTIRKAMLKLGVDGRDAIYLTGATQWSAYAVVSDDGDFYDPKAEKKKRKRLMEQRKGPMVKYAKSLGVEVTPLVGCRQAIPKCPAA